MITEFGLQDMLTTPGGISLAQITTRLALSFVLGMCISFFYRFNSRSITVENLFCFTLVSVTMVVATVMSVIGTNISLSLGLIGALSIIRFRAVIKNTADMAYLFWAIAEGLAIGSENYAVGWASTLGIGFVMVLITRTNIFSFYNNDYIVTFTLPTEGLEKDYLNKQLALFKDVSFTLKSSYINNLDNAHEFTFEASGSRATSIQDMVTEMQRDKNIFSISVLSPETNLYV